MNVKVNSTVCHVHNPAFLGILVKGKAVATLRQALGNSLNPKVAATTICRLMAPKKHNTPLKTSSFT